MTGCNCLDEPSDLVLDRNFNFKKIAMNVVNTTKKSHFYFHWSNESSKIIDIDVAEVVEDLKN